MSDKPEPKHAGGRPSKYDPKMNKQVFRLCLLGSTDKQLAEFLEVSESTLNLWKNEHPKFSEQIRNGREKADAKVAASLYKRAVGFKYEEITTESSIIRTEDDDGNIIENEVPGSRKVTKKMVVPDVGAQKMWLTNRKSSEWHDRTEVEAKNTNINLNIEPTPEEAARIKAALDKSI
jgi:hypothetical protein